MTTQGQVPAGDSTGSTESLEGLSYAEQFDAVYKNGFDAKKVRIAICVHV